MKLFERLGLDRISVQIGAVIMASLILLHIGITSVVFLTRDPHQRNEHPGKIIALAQLLDTTAPENRDVLVGNMAKTFPRLDIRVQPGAAMAGVVWQDGPVPPQASAPQQGRLKVGRIFAEHAQNASQRMAVELSNGTIFSTIEPGRPPALFGPFVQSFALFALIMTMLALWATSALTRPLRAFERAAEKFSDQIQEQSLPERGPREIRTAAAALNRLQAKIRILLEDRTRMLAALSHDLRTPLTRLRLRSEFIAEVELQRSVQRDLAQMQAMVEQVLVYLRDGVERRDMVRVDVAALVQTLCNEFSDTGSDVTYDGDGHAVVLGHLGSLQRAFSNLIDNAVRYGARARVHLRQQAENVVIDIADDGPGIGEDMRMQVLEPFVRGDAARGMDEQTGFGLGLPIAKAILSSHRGTLDMLAGTPAGLLVRIILPLAH